LPGASVIEKVDFEKITGGKTLADWVAANRSKFHPLNRWIVSELERTVAIATAGLEEFRLNESAQAIYDFVWGQYCDWYIEFSKELLAHRDLEDETQACLMYVLEGALKLAHPFIPFITEEIYQNLPARPGAPKGEPLMLQAFPQSRAQDAGDAAAVATVAMWKSSIEKLRTFRGENNISPKARPKISYEVLDRSRTDAFAAGVPFIRQLAQLDALEAETGTLRGAPTTGEVLSDSAKFFIPLKGLVDVDGELKRLEKEKQTAAADIEFTKAKLAKPTFIEKAPKELVDKEKEKLAGLENKLRELEQAAQRLGRLR
jgi:valyl-tRNA synthetase